VCNLASICLNKFVRKDKTFDFESVSRMAYDITGYLNKVVDNNYYPLDASLRKEGFKGPPQLDRRSNEQNRPIGIGLQAYADTLALMELSYDSQEAIDLSGLISEYIYLGSVRRSVDEAEKYGAFPSYEGSNTSKGILHFDHFKNNSVTCIEEWKEVKEKMKKFGIHNSLLIALMPTASTAHLCGNHEAVEPAYQLIFERKTKHGKYTIIDNHMVKMLKEKNLWSRSLADAILNNDGSLQIDKDTPTETAQILESVPENIKNIFKTTFNHSMKIMIKHAMARAPYIDQSCSNNAFFKNPTNGKMTSLIFDAWKSNLKTAIYYTRCKVKSEAFAMNMVKTKENVEIEECVGCGA
jgi:ribonucleoside-diphosphate reductase subunit M1